MKEDLRKKAKTYREKKDYSNALPIYKDLWEIRVDSWNKWLGWEYADTLKKLNQIDEAIAICREVYLYNKDFKYNNDLLCWCLYEKYFKSYIENNNNSFNKLIEIAEFITMITEQKGKSSAYESTVFKVIDILKSQSNISYSKILYWIDKLDYNLLSDDVIVYTLPNNNSKEGASRKEDFFSIKTKAFEKLHKYLDCIECCNIAFEVITQFHFDNDIWLELRKYYCVCMNSEGSDFENAINKLIQLANRKRHWVIYFKAFQCYCEKGKYKNAIVYGSKALLSNEPMDRKVKLLLDYGLALENIGDTSNAKYHFELVYHIRKQNSWSIHQMLLEKCFQYNIVDNEYKDKSFFEKFWIKNSQSNKKTIKGVVLSIMPHGKSGFIKVESGESYFFKKNSVISGLKQLRVKSNVTFCLVDSFDVKKQQKTKEAIEIIVIN